MVRARLLALVVVAGLGLAACSSASNASWTYAPASPATPAPSASAGASAAAASSGASSAPASASAGASAAASGGASGGAAGATVEITAQGIAFTTPTVTATAGQSFTLKFTNQDAGVPHNVHIKDSSGADVAKTEIITGVATTSIQVPALKAGTYPFVCDVHPNMTGTITVK